jgi:hypothetical protein
MMVLSRAFEGHPLRKASCLFALRFEHHASLMTAWQNRVLAEITHLEIQPQGIDVALLPIHEIHGHVQSVVHVLFEPADKRRKDQPKFVMPKLPCRTELSLGPSLICSLRWMLAKETA